MIWLKTGKGLKCSFILYIINPSFGAYFRTEVVEDVEGSIRKRKRKPRVVGAPSGADWQAASYCTDLIHGAGSEKSKEIMGKVTKTLEELFNHYKGKAENKNVLNSQSPIFGEKSSISEMDINLELEFNKFDDGGQDIKTEVDIYLADRKEKRDPKFDLLGWWKANSIKFHILSKLARHVLAMSISTVASESAFSTCDRVIDKYRSSFNTETAEAFICIQDWIRRTRVDLELGCSMKNKDIDEFNEKMTSLKIDKEALVENDGFWLSCGSCGIWLQMSIV
uniref:HAT C-terminal dimerisation domain-containing protein n=1 Tax=Lactuca sativa TaxID=4236 RepID=A0A9R1XX28_LACSA|nr:hypothetical protein LSAT_V11C200097660 [Lactuca sativa]